MQIAMLKAYKYRICPDELQKKLIEMHFGHVRHIYNWALAQKVNHYKETQKSLSKKILQQKLVHMKQTEKPWLNEVNSQSLLASLFNLETAYKNFFRKKIGFPKFKQKYDGHQSYQCPQHVTVDFDNGLLALPKIKNIKTKFHRHFSGQIKTVTISRTPSNKYFASILVDDKRKVPLKSAIEENKTLGLDLGLSHYLITDKGVKENHPQHLRHGLLQLRKRQQQFSRKLKYSKKSFQRKSKTCAIA